MPRMDVSLDTGIQSYCLSHFTLSTKLLVIDGGVKAFAQRAGKGQLAGVVSNGKAEKILNDVGYRYLVA